MNIIFPFSEGFTIYSKTGCPYCTKVIQLLEEETKTVVNCDEYLKTQREQFLAFIAEIAGQQYKTFPMVFYQGTFIGGYTDTEKWMREQEAFIDLTVD